MKVVKASVFGIETWIIWDGKEPYGPYDSQAEADSDRIGMERFERLQDKPGFITSDRKVDK